MMLIFVILEILSGDVGEVNVWVYVHVLYICRHILKLGSKKRDTHAEIE